ncbi:hypothetical protein THPR109532_15825 [Thalassospira profundimaris]
MAKTWVLCKITGMTMPIETYYLILVVGLLAGAYMLGMLLWSIVQPKRRVWPSS